MATLNIQVSKSGVDRVAAGTDSVANAVEIGRLIEATALPIRLLDTAVVEYFSGKSTGQDVEVEPEVLVQTDRDGELDLPRRIKIQVATLPRDSYDSPPKWFVDGVRQLLPQREAGPSGPAIDWDNAEAPLSRDQIAALYMTREDIEKLNEENGDGPTDLVSREDFIKKHEGKSTEELNEMIEHPYCSRIEEMAVSLFDSRMSGVLDRWGWLGNSGDNDTLIAEPYGINLDGIKKLTSLCEQLSWTFSIAGKSAHYPSATIRIEIKPRMK